MLISIDSLRADHVGAYGYFRNTTPNIDRVAANSIVFEQAVSQASATAPSHMTMLTSLYPDVHGVGGVDTPLHPGRVTLAEHLKNYGYRSAAFTGGGEMAPEIGVDKGFDEFVVIGKLGDRTPVLRWLGEHHTEKFFLFLHIYDVHCPFLSPEEFSGMFDPNYGGKIVGTLEELERKYQNQGEDRFFWMDVNVSDEKDIHHLIALYDGCIRFVDDYLGLFFKKMEELNLTDNTIIVITSDHGEQFMEHGGFKHQTVYEHDIHVPLIIHLPPDTNKMIKPQVRLIDLAPTLLEILDVQPLKEAQGISLLPLVSGSKDYNLPAFTTTYIGGPRSVRYLGYKYIYHEAVYNESELYNLNTDPNETKNLFDIEVEMRNNLSEMLESWQNMNAGYSAALENVQKNVNVSKATLEQLKSLGYI